MAEETKVEMTEPAATPAEPKEKAAEIVAETKDPAQIEAELERTREALKKANREAADKRKRLEELEKAEADRQAAAMTEAEKIQARLKELEQANAEKDNLLKLKERQELQRKVAKEAGLPEGLASRLSGETEEEIAADAKAILELLPKQEAAKPAAPKLEPTNPGNAKPGETRAQIKERTLGTNANPWAKGSVSLVERE